MTTQPKEQPEQKPSKPKSDKPPKQKAEAQAAAPVEAEKAAAPAAAPTAAPAGATDVLATPAAPKVVRAKGSKNVFSGVAHVTATFNNTIVSITDQTGNIIGWSSAGKVGFKGSRKSTAYAAQLVAQDAARQGMAHGLREVEIRLRGPGSGREAAVRALGSMGLEISTIKDVTPVPHNGCRPKKRRRV